MRRTIAVFLTAAVGNFAGSPLPDASTSSIGAQCVEGELASLTADSAVWKWPASDSTPVLRPQLVTWTGEDVFLNGRKLRCFGQMVAQRRGDSSLLVRAPLNTDLDPSDTTRPPHRLAPAPTRIPWFSFALGISLEAALKTRGTLPEWINRSVDSVGADVASERLSPVFELSILRFAGFQYSPGLFGGYRLRGTNDDLVDISYHESRVGLFLELFPRRFSSRFPESSFRVTHHWLTGQLELGTDTLRNRMIAFQGREPVVAQVEGNAWEYALEGGSAPFYRLFLLDKRIRYHSLDLTHGWSAGLVFGIRI